ncbi:MAG: MFS transporter [Leifsonia sp.]
MSTRTGSPSTARRQLIPLFAAAAIGAFAQSVAGSAGGLAAVEVGGGESWAGMPQAMIVLGSAAAAIGIGRVARRFGRGRALALGTAVGAIGALVVLVSSIVGLIALMLIGTLLFGAGNAAVMLSRYAAADRAQPSRRTQALTAVLVATSVGAVLGPLLLEPSDAVGMDLGLPHLAGCFLVGAIGFGVSTVFFALLVRAPVSGRTPASEPAESSNRRDTVVGIGVLSLVNIVMVGVMTTVPVHLSHLHVGLSGIGMVISLHIAAMFGPSAISGALVVRWGAEQTAMLAGAVLGLAAVLAAWMPQAIPAVAASTTLIGFGWNLGLVAGSSLLARSAPEEIRLRREGWGEVGMGAAAAGGGAVSGFVLAAGGFGLVVTVAGCTAIVLLAWAGLARQRVPAEPETSPAERRL